MVVRNRWLASAALAAMCSCAHERATTKPVRDPATATSAPQGSATPIESPHAATAAPAPEATEWKDGTSLLSNAGRYRVVFRRDRGDWPRGKPIGLTAWVFDAREPNRPLTEVELAIDAAMPDHQHGMNRTPVVRADPSGRQSVDGVLFHMAGYWELYFDITRGAHVERAQLGIEFE